MSDDPEMTAAVIIALDRTDVGFHDDLARQNAAHAAIAAVRAVIRERMAKSIPAADKNRLLNMLFSAGDVFGFCHKDPALHCWLRESYLQLREQEAKP